MPSRNRGRKKPKLRDLSREVPTEADLNALIDKLQEGPPIVSAILGSALIEHELESLLRTRIRHKDDGTWDLLTETDGPLATFSRKITAGYALGLYDEATRANLDIVRHIRNAFAHAKKLITFDHSLVLGEIGRVQVTNRHKDLHLRLKAVQNAHRGGHIAFASLCAGITIELMRKGTALQKYRNAYLRRKTSKLLQKSSPAVQSWMRALGQPPMSFPAEGGLNPKLPPGHQSDGPKGEAPGLTPRGILGSFGADRRNKGK